MVAAPTPIVRRQVDIDFESVSAGPWYPAGGPIETMFNAASISFPTTERFFIASVRAYQDRITDPVLREQVRGFIHQEAMHNKVHIDCNAMLARDNPNVRRAERVSEITFAILGKTPRAFRLSLSSALEHFTALTADTLMHYPDEFVQIVPPEVAQMWMWHAAEETEHKAVCFDVHQTVIGKGMLSYLNRVAGMLFATPLYLVVLITMGAVALSWGRPKRERDPEKDRPIVIAPDSDAARFGDRGMFGLMRELIPWRQYFSYYKPSFHPWDYDNSHFVAAWKKRYPDFGLAKASR